MPVSAVKLPASPRQQARMRHAFRAIRHLFLAPLAMFDSLSRQWRTFRRGTPGKRFQKVYESRSKQRGQGDAGRRKMLMIVGIIVAIAGLALLPLPGPGSLVLAGGLLILARESARVAQILDAADAKRHEWTRRLMARCHKWALRWRA